MAFTAWHALISTVLPDMSRGLIFILQISKQEVQGGKPSSGVKYLKLTWQDDNLSYLVAGSLGSTAVVSLDQETSEDGAV